MEFIMEHIIAIISIACTLLGLLITAVTFIGKFVKSVKDKKRALEAIKLCDAVVAFIKEAEGFTHYSGNEKKEFVMTKANRFALGQKIAFDQELVSNKVEELLCLSKEVNSREKDVNYTCVDNKQYLQQKIILGVK
ncbi:MAG: hypothetical protein FWE13_05940 [Firmicutes bacterium]|nr:hypothetical protein [Bacillota bacterium]